MRKSFSILLLVLLGLQCVYPATTYFDGYSFNGTTNSLDLGGYSTVYPLGTLSANYSIYATYSYPGIPSNSVQLAQQIMFLNSDSTHGLQYMDMSTGAPVLTKAYGTSSSNTILYPNSTNPGLYRMTHNIKFPPGSTQTSAQFYLVITNPMGMMGNKLLWYTLQLDYYPTSSGSSVAALALATTILKVTDISRGTLAKLIFVQEANKYYNFSVFPGGVCTGSGNSLSCTPGFTFNIRSVQTTVSFATNGFNGNELTMGAATPVTTNEASANPLVFVNNVAHYSYNFTAAGFYVIEYLSTRMDSFVGSITFQSDPYACPFNPDFGDYFGTFRPCTKSASPAGLPCASFDPVTQVCSLCIRGYILVNGTCIANTTCPARQYFSYGACVNVSSLCGSFDAFTGACLNCSDPANYDFSNGSCTRKAITCASNQWQSNYTCFNASVSCATFDPSNGKCLSCISNLYQLNTDGSCTLIVVNCPQGQYAVGLNCVTIPIECLNFDKTLGKCLSCIKGYFVEGGVCKRVVCPAGQVPSGYGIFCVDISPLCDSYDSVSGDCLSCKQKGYTVRDGRCVQISSGLAGCTEREAMGFGPCIGADLNCRTFNLVTGNCDECNAGYYLDFTGHCTLSAKCGAGQWSVNGECIGTPDNCLKVDNLGFCTQCVTDSYRLQQGQCVFFKSCQSQQYLNSAGQCVEVSSSCATWNPSNGLCVTCKEAGAQPSSGVCCASGQVYSSGSCADGAALQSAYQGATGPSCLIRHPSLSICLKCAEGFSPDYTVPYACSN